ncbi:NUDIX domain-containing protein [Streptomyces albidoflavus]
MPSAAPPPRSARPAAQRGSSRAIYAVTGVVDEVNDLILPGAFARTLASRPVKTVWHHGWKDPVGVVVEVEEWLPGDRRFADIPDWPAEAGALVATVVYNLRTRSGRDAYEQVKQWHEHKQAAFSIGYRVPTEAATQRSDGVRVIHHLDLYEVSPVLHGAHPLTRALEVKSADGPDRDDLEYKSTPSHIDILTAPPEEGVTVAGLAVKAADTGRVLMIQRALEDGDPAAGMWEIPGGHLEDGESALAAALREWAEETGSAYPATASIVGSWTAPNGIYRGFVAVVPSEAAVQINTPHGERPLSNPDDPTGEATEVTAWWPIDVLPDMALLRPECRDTPWPLLTGATLPQDAPAPARAAEAPPASRPGPKERLERKSARAAVFSARRSPRIESKSARAMVTEAKSRIPVESPVHLPESLEQLRHRLADEVRATLGGDGIWAFIEGTYADRVIVTVSADDEGGPRTRHFTVPYTVAAAGDITLGTPQPVKLATIVVPEGAAAGRAATGSEDVDARIVQPAVDALNDVTARVSHSEAETESLSGVRDKVRELISALSAKGLSVDESTANSPEDGPTGGDPVGLDLWEEDDLDDEQHLDDGAAPQGTSPESDAATPSPAETPDEEDAVRLDAEEVKAVLALMRQAS